LEDTFTWGSEPGPQLFDTREPFDFLIGIVLEFKIPNRKRLFLSYRYYRDFTYFYGSDKDLRYIDDRPDADFSATHSGHSLGIGLLWNTN